MEVKFIKVMGYKCNQTDKEILKRLFEQTMDGLYQTLNIKKDNCRNTRDLEVKRIIQNRDKTYLVMAYQEILSDTDNDQVKKVTVKLMKTREEKPSEAQLFLLQLQIQKTYDEYNKNISHPSSKTPFLHRDGVILFDDEGLAQEIHSANGLSEDIQKDALE